MTSKKTRSYDAAFKLKAVSCAEQSTNRGAARKFGVDERRIREWRQKKVELEKLPHKKKRLEGRTQGIISRHGRRVSGLDRRL